MTCASECKCKHHVCQISRAHALQVARNANRNANLRERMQLRYGYVPTPVPRNGRAVPRRSLALKGCVGMSDVVSVCRDRGRVSSCRSTVLSARASRKPSVRHTFVARCVASSAMPLRRAFAVVRPPAPSADYVADVRLEGLGFCCPSTCAMHEAGTLLLSTGRHPPNAKLRMASLASCSIRASSMRYAPRDFISWPRLT